MDKFYEGCLFCAFQEQGSCERCFECAEVMALKEGWIHSLGFYFSRCNEEHKASKWSQAILRLKRNCKGIVSVFGKIVACYMDKYLIEMKPYLITSVPVFETQCLFQGWQNSPMQFLVHSAFVNLKDTKWINYGNMLIQTRQKLRKQQSCRTDGQRLRNIKGIYAVKNLENVKGRNVILLDDVTTSGATMKECSTVLLEAGVKEVIGLTLAKTFRKGENNGNQS